ncbi:MAG: type II secretion system F family protein, partial [Dehalococcoidia bacterium]|nr:type II secretion system F family protein [Dehalococcoidia bacterium]
MNYEYVARSEDNRIVKGKLSATGEESATDMLAYSGYSVLSLKEITPFFQAGKFSLLSSNIKLTEVIMFSRQLALLLESGTDVVTSLELLEAQMTNRSFKKIVREVVSDVRAGRPLSEAMAQHPRAFSPLYHRLVSVGERTGTLEVVLRRAADYIERSYVTQKSVKNAMVYPIILLVVTFGVVALMVGFVLPAFSGLYSAFDIELPAMTRGLLAFTDWSQKYGLWVVGGVAIVIVIGLIYIKMPAGKVRWGKVMLTLPYVGRINLLNELSRSCRTTALLYQSGLALPEVMTMVVQGTSNRAMTNALSDVQQAMIAGEGLSGPMSKNKLFLPLMVQMTSVGEETGNLDHTLNVVAESYETEADEKTKAMIAM